MNHHKHGAMPGTDTSTTTVYEHPDGGRIWFTADGRIVISEPWDNDEESVAALPIAANGMRMLAYRLLALATELEGTSK